MIVHNNIPLQVPESAKQAREPSFESALNFFKKVDAEAINKKNRVESKRNLKALKARRENDPVTKKAIEGEAELFRAAREGKEWASKNLLFPQGGSLNSVYKLNDSAFFKVGAGNEQAAGKMEKLMWDIAVLLNFEEFFVPTGEAEIGPLRGGIQVAQKGCLLYDMQNKLSKAEVVKGIFISIVMGMSDAHEKNIFVTNEGKIKFFDNTRSLPNGNGYIDFGGGTICSAYRCALLDQLESSLPLDSIEIKNLRKDVAVAQKNLSKLWAFLNTPQTKAMLSKLPPGWMDVKGSFEAMRERVDLLDEALKKGKIKTAQDMVEQACPGYKFACAVSRLHLSLIGHIITSGIHSYVGGSMPEMLDKLIALGVDLKLVKRWCDNPALSLAELDCKLKSIDLDDLMQLAPNQEKLVKVKEDLLKSAVVNYKDLPRAACEKLTSRA